tara:strand:- start:353 stop:817 length:465 start_codon:yes stop_codon:yes gene_type:complete
MASELGWAFIKGGSIAGTDNRILVKNGGQALAVQGLEWNSTTQTLSVAAASSGQTAISITTGEVSFKKANFSDAITATTVSTTGDIAVGANSRSVAFVPAMGRGNYQSIDHNEVVPANFRTLAYNTDIATNGCLTIETGAVLAIDADFPAALQC